MHSIQRQYLLEQVPLTNPDANTPTSYQARCLRKINARYLLEYTLHITHGHQPLITVIAHDGMYDDFVDIPW
jgi:hypothetical protein